MADKFNDIFLKAKTVTEKAQRGYKIYTDKEKFQRVEATTVSEAVEKSGIKNPFKIEIAGLVMKSIFSRSELAEKQNATNPAPSPAPAAVQPAPSQPETPQNPQ